MNESQQTCKVLPFCEKSLDEASSLLHEGKLVAFPTETVYGLGANAFDPKACLQIFAKKKRPLSDPLIVHIPSAEEALKLVELSERQRKVFDALSNKFWPGPFTLILPAVSKIPKEVTGGTGWVGVRVPDHKAARTLLDHCKLPVAAPSANLFMHVSPTTAAHVFDDFFDQDLAILDDGQTTLGIESTILKIEDESATFLRLGSLAASDVSSYLQSLTGFEDYAFHIKRKLIKEPQTNQEDSKVQKETEEANDHASKGNENTVEAPGQFLKHYSPWIPLFTLSDNKTEKVLRAEDLKKTVFLDFGGSKSHLKNLVLRYEDLSPSFSTKEAMTRFYFLLRAAETTKGAEYIVIVDIEGLSETLKPEEKKHVAALADKIYRSCSGQSISITP